MHLFRIDDIIAALLLSLAMFRRLEVLSISREANQHVSDQDFEHWRQLSLRGYNLAAIACAGKVLLSVGWFYLFVDSTQVLRIGGLVIFVGWVLGIVAAWRQLTEAGAERRRLNIQRHR